MSILNLSSSLKYLGSSECCFSLEIALVPLGCLPMGAGLPGLSLLRSACFWLALLLVCPFSFFDPPHTAACFSKDRALCSSAEADLEAFLFRFLRFLEFFLFLRSSLAGSG